jgi:C2 domain
MEDPDIDALLMDPAFKSSYPALHEALLEEAELRGVMIGRGEKAGEVMRVKGGEVKREEVGKKGDEGERRGEVKVEEKLRQPKRGEERDFKGSSLVVFDETKRLPGKSTTGGSLFKEAGAEPKQRITAAEETLARCTLNFETLEPKSIRGKEKVFLDELLKQISLVLPGMLDSDIRDMKIVAVDPFVTVEITGVKDRINQLKELIMKQGSSGSSSFLESVPLLREAVFISQEIGSAGKFSDTFTASDWLQKLSYLQSTYKEVSQKRNSLIYFHQMMDQTDIAKQKAKGVHLVGQPIQVKMSAASEQPFPYNGVPGVLSPRSKAVSAPQDPILATIEGTSRAPGSGIPELALRPVPPPADSVESKRRLDRMFANFTESAATLRAHANERNRLLDENKELEEIRRLVDAGLVSPGTAELLLQNLRYQQEQRRALDELQVDKVLENERQLDIERNATDNFIKSLYVKAEGGDGDQNSHAPSPRKLAELKEQSAKETIKSAKKRVVSDKDLAKFTVFIDSARNLPPTGISGGYSESYVYIKVISITGAIINEVQSRGGSPAGPDPMFEEALYFEVPENPVKPKSVSISVWSYNAVGLDSCIAQTDISYLDFKKSCGDLCWSLQAMPGYEVQAQQQSTLVYMRIQVEGEFSVHEVKISDNHVNGVEDKIKSSYALPLPESQVGIKHRYWRHIESNS